MDQAVVSVVRSVITSRVHEIIKKAEDIYCVKFPIPSISLKLKGRVAGEVSKIQGWWYLRFNPYLYMQNKADFYENTIPHGVAHMVAHELFRPSLSRPRIKPHGEEWKKVMRDLGVEPKRCHSYDMTNVPVKKWDRPHVYSCSCREFHLTNCLHRKIRQGRYRQCQRCKGFLYFVRSERENEIEMS